MTDLLVLLAVIALARLARRPAPTPTSPVETYRRLHGPTQSHPRALPPAGFDPRRN